MARSHLGITPLTPWLNEPYQKTRVLQAVGALGYPFTLSEAVEASGLSIHVVHMVLTRAVKQHILTRTKMAKTYPGFTRGRWLPGRRTRRVYLYSFVEAE